MHIYGENDKKINLFVDSKSVVRAEKVSFYQASSPASRVLNRSFMEIKEVFNENDSIIELGMENDETSCLNFNIKESTETTVARLIGEVLFEAGAFKSDEFKLIEASEPDFISQNVGGTAQQTLKILESAKGGVLFIDEAYALNKKGRNVDFGIEAINTILKYMEDHRNEIMIIFA